MQQLLGVVLLLASCVLKARVSASFHRVSLGDLVTASRGRPVDLSRVCRPRSLILGPSPPATKRYIEAPLYLCKPPTSKPKGRGDEAGWGS